MAISFPDIVSNIEFAGAGVRTEISSGGKTSSAIALDECKACPIVKPGESTDEDFNAVLASMFSGVGLKIQPLLVADETQVTSTTASIPVAEDSTAGHVAASTGFGQPVVPMGTAKSLLISAGIGSTGGVASALSSVDSHNSADTTIVSASPVLGPSADTGFLETARNVADTSLDDSVSVSRSKSSKSASTAVQSQSVPESLNPESLSSVEFLSMKPLFSGSVAADVPRMSEVPIAPLRMSLKSNSESSEAPEALSQDAIDALERIGRLPGSPTSDVSETGFSESYSTASVLSVSNSAAPLIPVAPSLATTADVISGFNITDAESSVSVSLSAVHSESKQLKIPTTVVSPTVAAQVASPQILSTTLDSKRPDTIVPVISTSLSDQPEAPTLVSKSESTATEITTPSGSDLSAPELNLHLKSAVRPSALPGASQDVESVKRTVRTRTVSMSASTAADDARFSRKPEFLPDTAGFSDIVRGDVVQLNATGSFSDMATPFSNDLRQPLSTQVSHAIMEHIERSGVRSNDSLTVRLDPPELGEMKIELSQTMDGLAVRVTARESVTMDMLFARGQEIETQLRGQQMNLKSLEFLRSDMPGNAFSQGQHQNAESRTSEKFLNQVRRGSRSSSPAIANVGRVTTPESVYGLNFRA